MACSRQNTAVAKVLIPSAFKVLEATAPEPVKGTLIANLSLGTSASSKAAAKRRHWSIIATSS
jgi:23S rRNA maturation-related 3'-5' exoribonuclease YhaM